MSVHQAPGVRRTDYPSLLRLCRRVEERWAGSRTLVRADEGPRPPGVRVETNPRSRRSAARWGGGRVRPTSEVLITSLKICYKCEARERRIGVVAAHPDRGGPPPGRSQPAAQLECAGRSRAGGRTPRNLRVAKSQAPRGASAPYMRTYPQTPALSKFATFSQIFLRSYLEPRRNPQRDYGHHARRNSPIACCATACSGAKVAPAPLYGAPARGTARRDTSAGAAITRQPVLPSGGRLRPSQSQASAGTTVEVDFACRPAPARTPRQQ